MKIRTLDVHELNNYIKRVLMQDPILENVQVRGEISNFKIHYSGNVYLSLKDEFSKINCIIFKDNFDRNLNLEDGMKVIVSGYISSYTRDGIYQLYIKEIQIEGQGDLFFRFMQMKDKLEKKGYFNKEHKKDICKYPKNIGVVTSATGAVIRDIINVVSRRYPKVGIKLYPVLVQGPGSSKMIEDGIKFFNKKKIVDIIIIGRGGGSIEELWSFNEENVANAIFESEIPIISAVGHETDFTISDFVADMRAPTPSAAAELATPDINDIYKKLDIFVKRVNKSIESNLKLDRQKLEFKFITIKNIFEKEYFLEKRLELDSLRDRLDISMDSFINKKKEKLNLFSVFLGNLNPFAVMDRGYALVEKNGELLKDIEYVEIGEKIDILLNNGKIIASVDDKKKNE